MLCFSRGVLSGVVPRHIEKYLNLRLLGEVREVRGTGHNVSSYSAPPLAIIYFSNLTGQKPGTWYARLINIGQSFFLQNSLLKNNCVKYY